MEFRFNLENIDSIAQKIAESLQSKVVLFYGQMGSGKTTLIKSLTRVLGSNDNVTSPTYSLVNEYKGDEIGIFHFDLYRLKDEREAIDFGFEEYLDHGNLVLIEWPEKVLELLPESVDVISLQQEENGSRTLKLYLKIDLTDKKLMMTQNFY
ncbi:tRNA threonylcarbamoyladenosine biosynthesis protein TsaE [Flavobacteriaceae bacterium MAR_2010_188]|nr:tRNA threonylcarbamoyladenosine biosynthesis protein TsaE [Flavobacteriaceae bacterium MAR_2010_188]